MGFPRVHRRADSGPTSRPARRRGRQGRRRDIRAGSLVTIHASTSPPAQPSKLCVELSPWKRARWTTKKRTTIGSVVMTVIGTTRADSFPATIGARRGLCALSAVLVAATMAAAVVTG